jgi:hypothetical protein
MRGTGSHDVVVEDVFIPKRHTGLVAPLEVPGTAFQGEALRSLTQINDLPLQLLLPMLDEEPIGRDEHAPGEPAPSAGTYELLNVFGSPTGLRVYVMHEHPLPAAPKGHSWTLVRSNQT